MLLKFPVGSLVRQETPDEGRRIRSPKRCECNNKYEENSPKTLNDKKTYLPQFLFLCHIKIRGLLKAILVEVH